MGDGVMKEVQGGTEFITAMSRRCRPGSLSLGGCLRPQHTPPTSQPNSPKPHFFHLAHPTRHLPSGPTPVRPRPPQRKDADRALLRGADPGHQVVWSPVGVAGEKIGALVSLAGRWVVCGWASGTPLPVQRFSERPRYAHGEGRLRKRWTGTPSPIALSGPDTHKTRHFAKLQLAPRHDPNHALAHPQPPRQPDQVGGRLW